MYSNIILQYVFFNEIQVEILQVINKFANVVFLFNKT